MVPGPGVAVSTGLCARFANRSASAGAWTASGEAPELPSVVAIGPLPPWITGQSIATEAIVARFRRELVDIHVVSTAPLDLGTKLLRRLSRLPRYVSALRSLVRHEASGWAYLAVDADSGMYFNILCAALGRWRGLRIMLHHHAYSYVSQTIPRMQVLAWVVGAEAVHVTLCRSMSIEMRQRYGSALRTVELSNAHVVRPRRPRHKARCGGFTIGHLSNLSIEKGLCVAIATFRRLLDAGIDARLRLAGPAANAEVAGIIEAVTAEMPGQVIYDGPLLGEAKERFFDEIDAFVFPSRYRHEAESIVLVEALAAGTPVIAYGQGCIPHLIGEACGLALHPSAAFEHAALALLVRWAQDRTALDHASAAARRQFEQLRLASEGQLAGLLRGMGVQERAGLEMERG
jgi:glycosyltransferase involved in cell wall biosynthesis